MFAVYASRPNPGDPLASLVVGERPEPEVPDGWLRVKISHASLNRHDLFTLRGITAQEDPIPFPMILGNDGAGQLDDGTLPRKVRAVIDNIGPASWEHSLASVARGGTIVITGLTTGPEVKLSLLPMLSDQIAVCGSIMGTLQDMKNMISFIVGTGIKPAIGQVLPMERAKEAFASMWEGDTHGKTVFTR